MKRRHDWSHFYFCVCRRLALFLRRIAADITKFLRASNEHSLAAIVFLCQQGLVDKRSSSWAGNFDALCTASLLGGCC